MYGTEPLEAALKVLFFFAIIGLLSILSVCIYAVYYIVSNTL